MLIVLSGLPGTGKTRIGKALAAKRSAAYVRVDEIEHALRRVVGQSISYFSCVPASAIAHQRCLADLGAALLPVDHDVKAFVRCRRDKVTRDEIELLVGCRELVFPARISRPKPRLTDGIGNVEVM